MDEMKSAMERALERADRMGKLSPEEMRQQKEAEYTPIGEAIAQRFLEHGYTSILGEQLDKFDAEGKSIATRAALSALMQSINIEDKALTERALQGIISLQGSEAIESIFEDVMRLFGQYAWQKKLCYEENSETVGKAVRNRLIEAGIGGSAVGDINIENDELWMEKSSELHQQFEAQLEELKKSLASALGFV